MWFMRPLLQLKKSQQTFRLISRAIFNRMTPTFSSPGEVSYNQPKNIKQVHIRSLSGSTSTFLGTSFFNELVEKSTDFADKSLLIRDFLESPAKVVLITCPRRWGKSVNLTMIQTFLSVQVDRNGNKYPDKTQTSNYKLFHGTALRNPLKIARCADILKNYQGEYPVIMIDFKDAKGKNFQEILNGMKASLSEAFEKHSYLLSSPFLREYEKDLFIKYTEKSDSLDLTHIKIGIRFLSKILRTHFNKKVFVFIDEYDTPINGILRSRKFSEEDMTDVKDLFEAIMSSALKSNEHLEKGFVTGILRIAKSGLFSGVNNLVEYHFLNNRFCKYYGYTENEVEELFEAYNLDKAERLKAKNWYNGYRVSGNRALEEKDLLLYNPWSINQFLFNKKIENYWVESGNIDFIKDLFKVSPIKSLIESLLIGENADEIKVDLQNLNFSLQDFFELRNGSLCLTHTSNSITHCIFTISQIAS